MRNNKISLIYNNCRNWLNLYEHSELFFLSNNEQSRKVEGRMLIINGYTKEIKKLNNVFLLELFVYSEKLLQKKIKIAKKLLGI